jgi:phospholipid N-methyltransferase
VAGDRVDAVEINKQFVSLLERRREQDPIFSRQGDQLRIIHSAVQDLPGQGIYDFIISGLPLNSLPSDQVREIFQSYIRLLKPGGTLTYYEYVFIRQLTSPFVNRRERRRLYRVGRLVNQYIRSFQVRRQQVFINVPPAVVRHLRFQPLRPAIQRNALIPIAKGSTRPSRASSRRRSSVSL